ncbi:DUF3035 domain-containing protein [Sphingomonas sabuli]|uniref:DUF3035 domain-containing protein n=1 Tax=Sphingomonas sabuli TaxID=2764186 RepID=A0A7G9L1I6_9SPHN|nr:DUF3035 domain-containing protein [Sphingomonas sabuli]QNM82485.1 DUF3035 domain-containing protein [Sphingomonas sabuli]
MRKSLTILLIPAIALGGCTLFKGRQAAPDEFAVARNAPLIIPPDYTLTPPAPGTAATTPQDAQTQAIEALFGGPAPRPTSERTLLEEAGRESAALGARSVAGDPDTTVVDMGQTTRAIIAAPEADTEVASAQVP